MPAIDSLFFREPATADEGFQIKLLHVITKENPPVLFHWLKNGPYIPDPMRYYISDVLRYFNSNI